MLGRELEEDFRKKVTKLTHMLDLATTKNSVSTMSSSLFSRVPVIDVHLDNFTEVWPSLTLAVKSSTFIGMDLELSGLGNRKRLNSKAIDDRYAAMAEVAKTRSVLSLGLSCFKLTKVQDIVSDTDNSESSSPSKSPSTATKPRYNWKFLVQTYNILVLCTEDFIVEPITLKFLVDHGFDFNKQYARGIPYYRGNDQRKDQDPQSMRQLLNILIQSRVPVVFHNALVDLVFLYHSLYASLPPTIAAFTSDLTEIFEGGVFDTKYITEYMERLPASYLEYAFRRCQRTSSFSVPHSRHVVSLEFLDYPSTYTYIRYCRCDLPDNMVERGDNMDGEHLRNILCHQYASFGWCPNGTSCPKSHDIDQIIDLDGLKPAKKSRRRKRRNENQNSRITDTETDNDENTKERSDNSLPIRTEEDMEDESEAKKVRVTSPERQQTSNGCESSASKESSQKESDSEVTDRTDCSNVSELGIARKEGHRAGYDAFMTGYIMACCVTRYGKLPPEKRRNLKMEDLNTDEFKNKIYLCGKDIPMVITKSAFAKTSKDHRDKIFKINTMKTGSNV